MCGRCVCVEKCGCSTACCCCFRIPVSVGYVICSLWLFLNGLTFPLMSFFFWPGNYIFYGSCVFCGVNVVFAFIALANMSYRIHRLFNAVLYGVCTAYLLGGLMIVVGIYVDVGGSSELMRTSFQRKFGVSIHPATTFRMLHTIQIIYYAYLFVSYVYCGFIFQLYEIRHDKRYRK